MLDALEGDSYAASSPPSFSTTVPVTIQTPATGTSTVRVTKDGGYTVSSFPAPAGYTGKKFTRTSVGKETLVAITDLESTRRVLDHHFKQREGASDIAKRSATRLVVDTGVPFGTATVLGDITGATEIKISHGFPASFTTTKPPPKTPTTISGQVYPVTSTGGTVSYKVSGRFECGGVTGCEVLLTPNYDAENNTLTGVALGVSDKDGGTVTGAVLYFRPSASARIPLDGSIPNTDIDDVIVSFVDGEYMAFGYWLREPSTPGDDYTFQVFANAIDGARSPETPSVSASFTGTAVGVYVEQGDLSKRQGQFTASVNLTAATGGDLGGEIGRFQTTPMGGSTSPTTSGSWLVDLTSVGAATVGAAKIMGLPGSTHSEGGWRYNLVANHANADPNDDPSAAVGVFDTRIEDLLHLSGAFGASRD